MARNKSEVSPALPKGWEWHEAVMPHRPAHCRNASTGQALQGQTFESVALWAHRHERARREGRHPDTVKRPLLTTPH